jgi:lipoprotein NlpI
MRSILPWRTATAFYDRGILRRKLGDPGAAIADYDDAIRLDPKDAKAFSNRGLAYQGNRDPDRASADYDEAITLDLNSWGGFGSRGNALEAKGDFDGAIADCSETIRIDPRRIAGYRSRRLAYFYAADFGTAVSDSARTVEDKPADAYAALWLYIVGARVGHKKATAELETNAEHLKAADRPYPVVELYLGLRTPEATLAASAKPDDRCGAQFYIGEWRLLQADRPLAIESLDAAADTCPKALVEYRGAWAELKRLGQ